MRASSSSVRSKTSRPATRPKTLTVSLDAGSYVFICNIVEEEGQDTIVHHQQGMRTGFTVE